MTKCHYCDKPAKFGLTWARGKPGSPGPGPTLPYCGTCSIKEALAARGMTAPVAEGVDYRLDPLDPAATARPRLAWAGAGLDPVAEKPTPSSRGAVVADETRLTVDDLVRVVKEVLDEKLKPVLEVLGRASNSATTAVDLLEADPHSFGTRPCQTCRSVSTLIGRPFGCSRPR